MYDVYKRRNTLDTGSASMMMAPGELGGLGVDDSTNLPSLFISPLLLLVLKKKKNKTGKNDVLLR